LEKVPLQKARIYFRQQPAIYSSSGTGNIKISELILSFIDIDIKSF